MKKLKIILLTIGFFLIQNCCMAQETPAAPPFVSPYYYGPNAFPIPDILVNTSDKLKIGVAYDYFLGNWNYTHDMLLRTHIPLWTKRANLSLWWPVYEVYYDGIRKGSMSGDVYLSIDMQMLEDKGSKPSWTLRAALKTASGGGYDIGRYYDCPGYYFDTYIGKLIKLGTVELQLCGGGGFLCWQTDNGQQNDAFQYGILAGVNIGKFKISETFSGYNGWQSNSKANGHLVHDCPMSLKTNISYTIKNWEICGQMQYGLKDYPFSQFQLGANFLIDILNFRNKKQ